MITSKFWIPERLWTVLHVLPGTCLGPLRPYMPPCLSTNYPLNFFKTAIEGGHAITAIPFQRFYLPPRHFFPSCAYPHYDARRKKSAPSTNSGYA